MRQFLIFTLGFVIATALAYSSLPSSEAFQWPNLILGYYIGAAAALRLWK